MRAKLRSIEDTSEHELRVLTYNVLAQCLIHPEWFPTNGSATLWGERFEALKEELVAYNPDILFLQEVDEAKLHEWEQFLMSEPLKMEMKFFGVSRKRHGVVLAYKSQQIRVITEKTLEYDMASLPRQIVSKSGAALQVVEIVSMRKRLVLGTTHLYWHPDADFERLRELVIFVEEANKLCGQYEASGIILGGDFNSTLESPAYEFMKKQILSDRAIAKLRRSANVRNFGLVGAQPGTGFPTRIRKPRYAVERLVRATKEARQPRFMSAYAELIGEPEFTNRRDDFRETIDYIFVSDPLKPKAVLAVPTESELGPEPNSLPRSIDGRGYPSDHLAIAANIALG